MSTAAGENVAPYIHPSAFVEDGVSLEQDVKVWHFAHVRKGAVLERGVSIGKDVFIDEGVRVFRGTRIQNGVSLYRGVELSPYCFIGPHVIFTNDVSPRAGNRTWNVISTKVELGASIGAGAIIRCGITLGAFSLVGAGAIVTSSIPPFHLVTGVPAKVTKKICACGQTMLDLSEPLENLVRDCCRTNMHPELLPLAEATLSALA
jgi:UDP-2-acetamido-3-amino-2,3-dideoxy-glucuronate N-acetyltransferase